VPSSIEILEGLARIANGAYGYAVAWHVLVAGPLVAVLGGYRPGRRWGALLLALPLASASVFAWAYGNPFNGALVGALAVIVATGALSGGRGRLPLGPPWARVVGIALVAFAWVYPHFLEDRPFVAYLVGAPMGLIPCPSIALSIGLSLLADNPGARRQACALALGGIFYGIFGAVRLGVWIDLALLGGAVALLVHSVPDLRHRAPLPAR
jgi:hypothetical protein